MSAEDVILKINFAILAAPALLASQKKSQAIEINAANHYLFIFHFLKTMLSIYCVFVYFS